MRHELPLLLELLLIELELLGLLLPLHLQVLIEFLELKLELQSLQLPFLLLQLLSLLVKLHLQYLLAVGIGPGESGNQHREYRKYQSAHGDLRPVMADHFPLPARSARRKAGPPRSAFLFSSPWDSRPWPTFPPPGTSPRPGDSKLC